MSCRGDGDCRHHVGSSTFCNLLCIKIPKNYIPEICTFIIRNSIAVILLTWNFIKRKECEEQKMNIKKLTCLRHVCLNLSGVVYTVSAHASTHNVRTYILGFIFWQRKIILSIFCCYFYFLTHQKEYSSRVYEWMNECYVCSPTQSKTRGHCGPFRFVDGCRLFLYLFPWIILCVKFSVFLKLILQ